MQRIVEPMRLEDEEREISIMANTLSDGRIDQWYYFLWQHLLFGRDEREEPENLWTVTEYAVLWPERHALRRVVLCFGLHTASLKHQDSNHLVVRIAPIMCAQSNPVEVARTELSVELDLSDEKFLHLLKQYAACRELGKAGHPGFQDPCNRRHRFGMLVAALTTENLPKIIYTFGKERKNGRAWLGTVNLREIAGIPPGAKITFQQSFDAIAGLILQPIFAKQYPDYPAFKVRLINENFNDIVNDMFKSSVNRKWISKKAEATFGVLGLTHHGMAKDDGSVYVDWLKTELGSYQTQMPLGGKRLLEELTARSAIALEREFILFLLLALVRQKVLDIQVDGTRYSSATLTRLGKMDCNQFIEKKFAFVVV